MFNLAAAMYLLIAPVLAGTLVLIALTMPSLGLYTLEGIGMMAGAGFAAGLPIAPIAALILRRRTAGRV